jgi:osmotically-inducible protein OsmY
VTDKNKSRNDVHGQNQSFGFRSKENLDIDDPAYDDEEFELKLTRKPRENDFTDSDIQDYILERLGSHPNLNARNVSVAVMSGSVNLKGSVDTARSKMLVQEIVEALPGVRSIANHLRVAV